MSIANLHLQNVQPKAGTVATEQQPGAPGDSSSQAGAGGPGGPMGSLITFAPFLVFPVIFFMMFRRQKKETEARGKLKKGDTVLTNGGLIGELVEFNERVAKVRIAPGTTVQVLAATISPYVADGEKAAS